MPVIKLFFKDEAFVESSEFGGETAVLELDEERKKAKLLFVPNTSMIDRRKAERSAQSICKIGHVLPTGKRVGVGYNLDIY